MNQRFMQDMQVLRRAVKAIFVLSSFRIDSPIRARFSVSDWFTARWMTSSKVVFMHCPW